MTHTPRKRFGQNFLINENIIDNIIDEINPLPDQHFIEIGPGQGALTAALIASMATIDAVEIDRDLVSLLQQQYQTHKNFTVHNIDILKFSIKDVAKNKKLRVVGNLPYNISTPILFKMFTEMSLIQDMFFMLQSEVANRLVASPNCKEYGRLSIMAQFYCSMHIVLDVPREAFDPKPKVDSCIVHFTPHQKVTKVTNHALLLDIVTHAFNHRRKTISNSLREFISASELQKLLIDPKLRAENLSLNDYTKITDYLNGK